MSFEVKTADGEVMTQFIGHPIEAVAIGEHEIPLDHFCIMATHFLGGGFFGWGGKTPDCVNNALTRLFELYEKGENGKWIRKE